MNLPFPPEDELSAKKDEVREEVPNQAASGIGLGSILAMFAGVGIAVMLLLPAIQSSGGGAQRSTQAEMEQRLQAVEQAAREAGEEDGHADNR